MWFYSGSVDTGLLAQSRKFAGELARLRIPSHYVVIRGGHDWALWRGQAAKALYAASVRLVPTARDRSTHA